MRRRRSPIGSNIKGIWRLLAYFLTTFALIPVQVVIVALKLPWIEKFPKWYHRNCCRWLGFKIEILGEPSHDRPTLYVSNHSSYLDIEILGSLLEASFIAKAEVANWPVFGWLAKLQQSVFIDRKRHTAHRQRDDILHRVKNGANLVLFAEGTSSDGNHLRPFRSALLSVAEQEGVDLFIQPVSIAYTHINGIPAGRAFRPFVAWYGDMTMPAHLWRFARLGQVTARVEFHPTRRFHEFGSRKELTRYCEDRVQRGLAAALAGHIGPLDSTGQLQ